MSEAQYPKYIYHATLAPKGKVVKTIEDHEAEGDGWVETPADFPPIDAEGSDESSESSAPAAPIAEAPKSKKPRKPKAEQ